VTPALDWLKLALMATIAVFFFERGFTPVDRAGAGKPDAVFAQRLWKKAVVMSSIQDSTV